MPPLRKMELTPRVLRASAGSGKTYQLSSRFLQLVLLGEDPDKILATTFTKKAAGEIRDRIFHRLVDAAKTSASAEALGKELGLSSLTLLEVRTALKKCVSHQHRLNICTLDSFFSSLAKAFTSELKLPPQWRLFDENETKAFLDEAVTELCSKGDGIIELLRLVQRSDGGRKVHEMLVKQVSELRSIVYATPKAAWDFQIDVEAPSTEDLKNAIESLSLYPTPINKAKKPYIQFEKAKNKITLLMKSGVSWEERVLSEGGKLVSALITKHPSFGHAPLSDELHAIFEPIAQHLRAAIFKRISKQTKALRELTEQIVALYEAHRTAASAVSFDDVKRLIFEAAIVKNLPEIFFRIDTKIRHVLLDEFQDTSLDEWRLIEPIADEILAHSDNTHSFFCVGDTKQSIYGFRGGVAEIFDTLESRWSHLVTDRLEVSRRSSPVVLDFINTVFSTIDVNDALDSKDTNRSYLEAGRIWKKRFDPHIAHNKDSPGYVSVTNISTKSDESSAIEMTADEVAKLHRSNPSLTIGVLVRTQKTIAPCLYELAKRKVSASGEGGSSLLDSSVVSAVVSFLWFVDHPADSVAHFHAARSPLHAAFDLSEFDSPETKDRVSSEFREKVLSIGLRTALSELALKVDPLCSKRDRTRLLQLVEASIPFTSDRSIRLSKFVHHVRQLKILDPDQSTVRIMTIHKSKGLEFDAVFLCDLDGDLVPRSSSIVTCARKNPLEPPDRVTASVNASLRVLDSSFESAYSQEKITQVVDVLSVLYVALTRARHALYIYADLEKGKKSAGKILGSAINSDSYQRGDPGWYGQVSNQGDNRALSESVSLDVPFSPSQTRGARHLTKITPSSHVSETLFTVLSDRALAARANGTLLHALFEIVEWKDDLCSDSLLMEALVRAASMERFGASVLFADVIKEFHSIINKDSISSLLTKSAYAHWSLDTLSVQRERRFSAITGTGFSVGTIDRLVLGAKGGVVQCAEIIDFKSDTNHEKNSRIHTSQIAYYKDAIRAIYKLPESAITGKLVYLETGHVKSV